jgi:iron complex transport system ATP-binding protein
MQKLINIHQLCWKTKHKNILQNISLSVCKGEVIGIIGPNGAGKTSLLRCLTNQGDFLSKHDVSGTIYLKNKLIQHYSNKELAQKFALVMQMNNAIFSLSVNDVMKMGLLPHKSLFSLDNDHDKSQITLALNKVGLSHAIHSRFNQLSGGEQQRVLIARALVQTTEILILDEPTNHLDVFYQHQILSLVSQLGITVIMTVHDLNLASRYCSRLLLLEKGKLICDGSAEEVLTPSRLSAVFGLPCQRRMDNKTLKTQVTFYLPDDQKEQMLTFPGEGNHDE